ncbi:MAG: O-antigen ligase family protein [Oscillospiraceae bacterium]
MNRVFTHGFDIFLLVTVFFMLLELATTTSYVALEISLIILVISFVGMILTRHGFNPVKILSRLMRRNKASLLFWAVLAIYLILDFITLFYSPNITIAIAKYKVILLMLFIWLAISFYVEDCEDLDSLLFAVAVTGHICSLLAVLNLSAVKLFERYYILRLSLRPDYNVFAAVVFMSLLTSFFLLMKSKYSFRYKLILILTDWIFLLPIIYLSSSRRTALIALPACGVMLILLCLNEKRQSNKARLVIDTVFTTAVAAVLAVLVVCGLTIYMNNVYLTKKAEGDLPKGVETSAAQRYEMPEESEIGNKRRIIWSVAIDEYKSYNTKEKWFGKGAGYDIVLYDTVQSKELQEAYPDKIKVQGALSAHNFILADLLNGGIVKAVAGCMVWIAIAWNLLKLWSEQRIWAFLYCLTLGFVLVGCLISNRFGFVYDKFFWLFAILLCMENRLMSEDKRRGNDRWLM